MRTRVVIIGLLLLVPGIALAEGGFVLGPPLWHNEGLRWLRDLTEPGPPPMTCVNQLDFSVACDSEYIGKGIIL